MTNCACTAQFLKYFVVGALEYDFGSISHVKVRLILLVLPVLLDKTYTFY